MGVNQRMKQKGVDLEEGKSEGEREGRWVQLKEEISRIRNGIGTFNCVLTLFKKIKKGPVPPRGATKRHQKSPKACLRCHFFQIEIRRPVLRIL